MTEMDTERNRLLQKNFQEQILNHIGRDQWLTCYHFIRGADEHVAFFSALIPRAKVKGSLNDYSWDLMIDSGMPGFITYYDAGKEKSIYYRFGNDEGIEPLVFRRYFNSVASTYLEISEEFRHYHNLYYDSKQRIYYKYDEAGDEEEIIVVTDDTVKIKLKQIRQFLSIKNMLLGIFFECTRWSNFSLENLELNPERSDHIHDKTIFHLAVDKWELSIGEKHKSFSRLFGKKLIEGFSTPGVGIWYKDEPRKYIDFIIGIDREGKEITFSCEPEKLADYFGKNSGSPHFLTPVFFRREVLSKYYSKPDKYSVEDGYLRCGGLWGLRMDNNHEKYVIAFLGDLGQTLSTKEQQYWLSFNVPPDGTISGVQWKRGFLAQFADPEVADLKFKQRFESFQRKWIDKFGWPLFLQLAEKDIHYYTTLRIPLTSEQAEFDSLTLALAKLLIDSLNEKKLGEYVGELPSNTKGISKLEQFLKSQRLEGYEEHIKYLRNLYSLRSTGVGHRKGENYVKAAAAFGLDERDHKAVFQSILESAIDLLEFLEKMIIGTKRPT